MPDPYPLLGAYAAPARDRAELWRVPVALLLTALLTYGGMLAGVSLLSTLAPGLLDRIAWADEPQAAGVVWMLLNFAFLTAAMAAAMRALHGRGLGDVFGPLPRLLADARSTALAAFVLSAVVAVLFGYGETMPERMFDLGTWLAWMPLALPALLIQVSAEEVVFRGYLLQQMAARFRGRWAWMVLPSVLFALLHFDPEIGPTTWAIMLATGVFGLAAADLTARTGSLGPAIALHFVNNFFAIFVTSVQDDLAGLALWTVALDLSDPSIVLPLVAVDIALTGCMWLAVRVALRR